jgi:hypothetical protein
MVKKNTGAEAPKVERTPFILTGVPETKAEYLSLYELLKSLGITQISVLEGMIGRAE